MNNTLTTLQLEADMLGLWLDEALHDPQVTEREFLKKVDRYGEVLRILKRIRSAHEPVEYYA